MGYMDIDELMMKKSNSDNLFGIVHDKRTGSYVAFPSVSKQTRK